MSVKFSREFYGWDSFSRITLVIGLFFFVTGFASILGAILIVYSIWRSKSKNLQGRNSERYIFESMKINCYYKISNLIQRLKQNLKKRKIIKYKPMEKFREKRKYIITNCPKCAQKLRLPRAKGKIIVTCSKCASEFRLKT